MGLIQIGVSILTALLVGALTRGAQRTYFLLASSVLAVYWFQSALPLRSFDFWLPSLSLALTVLTWLITSRSGSWYLSENLNGFLIIIGLVTLLDFSRYFLPDPIVTATTPPQFFQYLAFILVIALTIAIIARTSNRYAWVISGTIILLIAILVVLKTPALAMQTSIFFRTLANR